MTRHFTGFMLSTCAKLLQSLRYFGLHFPQVPHTYSVSQPLSSHVSLSRNRHRRIAEIDVYTLRLDISLLLCCQLVQNCFNDWHVRQNFKSLLLFLVVRSSQYTQNFNCNVLYVYPKLELYHCICIRKTWFLNSLYVYWILEFLRVVHATSVYIRKTWIVPRYIYTRHLNHNTVYAYPELQFEHGVHAASVHIPVNCLCMCVCVCVYR